MSEETTDRTYLIKRKIERILEQARRDGKTSERPIVTDHEGKIGKDRMVYVSNGLQRTLDSYTDENVEPGYIAFDVIVNPLAYRKHSHGGTVNAIDRIARLAYDKFMLLRK